MDLRGVEVAFFVTSSSFLLWAAAHSHSMRILTMNIWVTDILPNCNRHATSQSKSIISENADSVTQRLSADFVDMSNQSVFYQRIDGRKTMVSYT